MTGSARPPIDDAEVKVTGAGKSRRLLATVFLVLIVGGLLIALSMKGQDSSLPDASGFFEDLMQSTSS